MTRVIVLTSLFLWQAAAPPSEAQVREWFAEYVDAMNRHDVDRTVRFYADDVAILRAGKPNGVTVADLRRFRKWERATNAHWEYRILEVRGDSAVAELSEDNDLHRALGLKRPTLVEYRFRNGQIYRMNLRCINNIGAPFPERLRDFEGWLAAKPTAQTASVLEDGRLIYDEEAGVRLLPFLKEWAAEQRPSRKPQ